MRRCHIQREPPHTFVKYSAYTTGGAKIFLPVKNDHDLPDFICKKKCMKFYYVFIFSS